MVTATKIVSGKLHDGHNYIMFEQPHLHLLWENLTIKVLAHTNAHNYTTCMIFMWISIKPQKHYLLSLNITSITQVILMHISNILPNLPPHHFTIFATIKTQDSKKNTQSHYTDFML